MIQPVVLLVEDSMDEVLLMERAFMKANIQSPLHIVSDGDEVVAYLAGDGKYADRSQYPYPSLILLDLKLPRRSGHEVLQWIRDQALCKRIPVVVLTSSTETSDINRAYDLGANSYLVKPVQFEALLSMVKELDLYWMNLNQQPRSAHR